MSKNPLDEVYVAEESQLIKAYCTDFASHASEIMRCLGASKAGDPERYLYEFDENMNGTIAVNPHLDDDYRNIVGFHNFRFDPVLSNITYGDAVITDSHMEDNPASVVIENLTGSEPKEETVPRTTTRNLVDRHLFDVEYRGSPISRKTIYSELGKEKGKISSQDYGYPSLVLHEILNKHFTQLDVARHGDGSEEYPQESRIKVRVVAPEGKNLMVTFTTVGITKQIEFRIDLFLDHAISLKFERDADMNPGGDILWEDTDMPRTLRFDSVADFVSFLRGGHSDYPRMMFFEHVATPRAKKSLAWFQSNLHRKITMAGKRIVNINDDSSYRTEELSS